MIVSVQGATMGEMVGQVRSRVRVLARPIVRVPVVVFTAALLLASCGGGDDSAAPVRTPGEPIPISIWHSMPNPPGAVLQRFVDQFNESQTEYQAELIFQGSYTDSLNKLINSVGSGNIPNVIQLSDQATQIMIDSEAMTPIQQFIDEEGYDLSDFDPKMLSYYRVDGTLYAMGFNLAGPILYYDRLAFEEAGLDPDRPPRTLEEVREYSEQLVQRDENGEVTRTGIALQISPWFFEQMLAKGGALYVNNGNGRDGRATEAVFDSDAGKTIIRWWDSMVDDGLAHNSGTDSLDAMLKLASGQTTMAIASTGALRAAIAALALAGRDVRQYDTGPMPGATAEDGGVVLGGAAFWILSDQPEDEQRGAWEFLKFVAGREQQARWHADTGYLPTRLSAYDEPIAVETREEFPQFETAVNQLRASPDNRATQGALLGPFASVRDRVKQAFERVLIGGADPIEELEAAAEDATEIIREYNRTAP